MDKDLNKHKVIKKRKKAITKTYIPEFKSVYSKIFYLELEKKKEYEDFEISLEELKYILMVPELGYIYSHLRLRVLDTIIKEFQEVNSPIQFNYEVIKKGEVELVKFKVENELKEKNSMLFEVLYYIGEKINKENILWAVGGSIVLNHYGLIQCPNDIDIIVHNKDIDLLDSILKSLGDKKPIESSGTYSTKYFYEYNIKGIDIDVMSDFAINHSCGVYKYPFDKESITDFKDIKGIKIPMSSLEDWYIAYQLMANREVKVNLIEDYLKTRGVKNPSLLKRALLQKLPEQVEKNVKSIIECSENL
ncbi:RepB family plasmid replication initiator protein [Clostridium sp. MSJ-4]|uniref:RepB family plasmid replication initiator protein n=1 Tax=Clostridium simiarum TaxID=2841506 RepID=A0ABS6F3Y2_9CLOT|nr:RepB family plasmid replication initiator protein [Clostridium simiarum]MBU5593237.1 RepB family plasmid replication initiator protein [Clostridium simiarum]